MRASFAVFASLFLSLACSDAPAQSGDDAGIPDVAPEASFAMAAHPDAPTVKSSGGKVLANPKLVVVTFGNDPLAPQIEAFAQSLGKSSYWAATTSEYGVGPATYAGAVHVDVAPTTPWSTDDLEAWLKSMLDGTHPEWPAADESTVYSVVFPKFSGVLVDGAPVCKSSPAYHFEIGAAPSRILYAAMNRCDPFEGLSGIDYVTGGLSHEWVEAATDPFYVSGPAYVAPPAPFDAWTFVSGGELADLCTLTPTVYFKPSDLPFTVQRSWSNASVLAQHDPCVPTPADPYFNAAPVLPDTIHGTYYGQPFAIQGAKVAIGASTTIEVDLFSEAPTDAFKVRAVAFPGSNLTFAWDATTGQNGDKLSLTVTRNGDGGSITHAGLFTIIATLGTRQSAWVGAVGD